MSPKLLVMRRGGLGDTLLMLPLLRCVRRARPHAALHFAGVTEFAEPFALHGVVEAVRSVEDLRLWDAEAARARLGEYEQVIGDVPGVADVAFDPSDLLPGEPAGLQIARRAGYEPRWPEDSWLLAPRGLPAAAGATVLAPGSGSRDKCLPRAAWLALARELPAPCTVVVGPVEAERDDPRAWGWPAGTAFFADRSVGELAQLLRSAAAYLGNDSGTTHLAAALGVPTTAFFTVTDPDVWAPVGPHVQVRRATRP